MEVGRGTAPGWKIQPKRGAVKGRLASRPMAAFDRSRPIVGVGMKMYLGHAGSLRYLAELAEAAPRLEAASVFVLPSFPVLAEARDVLRGSGIAHGAQDGHWEESGPPPARSRPRCSPNWAARWWRSGTPSAAATSARTTRWARKAAAAAGAGLVPLVCVGEEENGDGAEAAVAAQLRPVLAAIPAAAEVVIAYEPVWAIGADRPAPPDHVAGVLGAIRAETEAPVLYGGAVAPGQIAAILAAGADGVFASRSALTLPGLEAIVEEVA